MVDDCHNNIKLDLFQNAANERMRIAATGSYFVIKVAPFAE